MQCIHFHVEFEFCSPDRIYTHYVYYIISIQSVGKYLFIGQYVNKSWNQTGPLWLLTIRLLFGTDRIL